MFKLEENITWIEDSKLLAELGVMDEIEADGYYNNGYLLPMYDAGLPPDKVVPSYRLDKLLSVLPDEAFRPIPWAKRIYQSDDYSPDWVNTFIDLTHKSIGGDARGQEQIKAAVQLIALLHKEGLLETRQPEIDHAPDAFRYAANAVFKDT